MSTTPVAPPATVLTENQVEMLQLAATIFGSPAATTLDDAYQMAKNLVMIMQNDPDEEWQAFFAATTPEVAP